MADQSKPAVIFFDGVCNLCNGAVDWVLAHDRNKRHLFASLQGESAKKMLPASYYRELNSIVLVKDGKLYRQADAVLEILSELPGLWPIFARVGKLVPRVIRDLAYRFVARNRYRVFAKRDICRVPTVEERARFLD